MAGEKAQKRGGGSASGGSGVNKFLGNSETAGHIHEDEFGTHSTYEQQIQWLQEQFPELDKKQINDLQDSVDAWSVSGYISIRKVQQSGSSDFEDIATKRGNNLEYLIENSPKYYGKPIYRGINVSESVYNDIMSTLSSGGMIDMKGTSSWTSKESVLDNFTGYSGKNIIFVSENGTKAGTSIQHLSRFGKNEAEVLVSKLTRYGANRIKVDSITGDTYVYVDEYLS